MKNARKKKPAQYVSEVRCRHTVDYDCYPERGVRSHRKGQCSHWTFMSCGLCRRHCQKTCINHSAMWLIIRERKAKNRQALVHVLRPRYVRWSKR